MIWYDMIWYDIRHNSDNDPSISINLWHMLSDNWPVHVWTPASPHTSLNHWECGCSTFLPQEEQVRRQDGARPCTGSSLQLRMGSASFEFSIQNVDQYMYMYPPAPTPDQSLESAEAPLSSLGRGRRQGRLVHRSYTGSIQFGSGEHYLRVFFFNADWELYRALTATCTRAHLPQRPTNPLRVRMLHFPPLGEVGAEAGQHTTMQQFKV